MIKYIYILFFLLLLLSFLTNSLLFWSRLHTRESASCIMDEVTHTYAFRQQCAMLLYGAGPHTMGCRWLEAAVCMCNAVSREGTTHDGVPLVRAGLRFAI